MRNLEDAVPTIMDIAEREGVYQTALPWLSIVRTDRPTTFEVVLHEPSLCVVIQGEKEARVEDDAYRYDCSRFLLGAVHLPIMGAVIQASSEKPYLCLRINIDPALISELTEQQPHSRPDIPAATGVPATGVPATGLPATGLPTAGMMLGEMDEPLADTIVRLVDSLESRATTTSLSPLIQKELFWRLMQQLPAANLLAQMVQGHRAYSLHHVIHWLEVNYAQPVSVNELAAMARMSESSFHAHFKALTGISPLQFRNRLRLIKARGLMISQGYDAAKAGFEVGYQEPAQFSREYSRLFGHPPKRDIARLREAALTPFV